MKIETKFEVHNLVQHKFQRNPIEQKSKLDVLCCFEVMEVITQTCYGGTQVFYELRTIHGLKETDYIDGQKVSKWTDFTAGSTPHKGEYIRMREDELKAAPQDIVDLILGNS